MFLFERCLAFSIKAFAWFVLLGAFYLPVFFFLMGQNPWKPDESALNLYFFWDFWSDSWNQQVVLFSVKQASVSALLSIVIATPGAYLFSHYSFFGKAFFEKLAFLPFLLPSILVVLTMVLFLGNKGWLNLFLMDLFNLSDPPIQVLYSFWGIIIGHVFYNYPLAMVLVSEQWGKLSVKYVYVSQSLGVSWWRYVWSVWLPMMLPSFASAFVLIFLMCLNSFAIILVLGGGVRHTTIEVLIYQLARIDLDFSGAVMLSLLQALIALCTLFLFLHQTLTPPKQQQKVSPRFSDDLIKFHLKAWFLLLWAFVAMFFSGVPLVSLVLDSLIISGKWSLQTYQDLFSLQESSFLVSLWNSLHIGILGAFTTALIGVGILMFLHQVRRYRREWEAILLLPMALSSVVLGVAWFYWRQRPVVQDVPLLVVIVMTHAVLASPYWLRLILPVWDSIPQRWFQESRVLGVRSWSFCLKVLYPWLSQSLFLAFAVSFALSLGELNAILMITDESIHTLPLEIYAALGGYRFEHASAAGVILMLLSLTVFFLIEKLKR